MALPAPRPMSPGRRGELRFQFGLDRIQLGVGGVAFLHHPVERLVEVADARSRRLGHQVPYEEIYLARGLALEQLLRVFLVEANHSVPFLPSWRSRYPCCGPCPSPSAPPPRRW